MSKQNPPLVVEIPQAGVDQPAWSRVGIVGLVGFVIGIAWPLLAGVKIGPNVPGEGRPQAATTASASAAPPPPASAVAPPPPTASAVASAETAAPPSNQEQVLVSAGKTLKCADKKNRKVSDCDEIAFDTIAQPRLEKLFKCPSAMGLEGKMAIGVDLNFDKKDVRVVRIKKGTALPSSTVNGILQCAEREFEGVLIEEVEHKYRRYSLSYTLSFYPPGKHPDEEAAASAGEDKGEGEEGEKGASEGDAGGSATVSVDSAILRNAPKGKEAVGRLVRGTKVKILSRDKNWYKVEYGSKTGWLYRSTIGL